MGSSFGVNANVFPENKDDIWWLLSYLNSGFCTYMVRSVLIRTNMITSGYVSRIPVIEFTEEIKTNLALLGKKAYEKKRNNESLKDITAQIDEIIFKFIRISESSQTLIDHFNKNLIKHV
ncbi:hypothetical protein [Leptospira idonii]|uniref:Uncharacterized protein n=1 Tax=Leptospira idonii TaxID=1193500 RepID=A0A4R9M1M1_9LEPT|nr:hypothetical protein [Leptospira idonii]TGN19159.1 hypothetical protein EHS15_10390 [Leptospira idonii]